MKFPKILLASSLSTLLLTACGSDSGNTTGGNPADCSGFDEANRTLSGLIACDATITAGEPWTLKGVVKIGQGDAKLTTQSQIDALKSYTLTIEKGANIKADNDGVLIVTRGSKIEAIGTKEAPITFSSADDNFDHSEEWGGIIIQGFAPQTAASGDCNEAGFCNVLAEGVATTYFGGTNPADDSGELKYVVIAEGGKVKGKDNEINGLTLMGVGHGTQLNYIQVHGNLDDGIEWFGGTVNLKHAVLTNNDDDDLDFDEGYQGHIQHVLIIKNQTNVNAVGDNDPRGIEANSSDDESVAKTKAKLANITIIGSDRVRTGSATEPGMRLRGDVTVDITNSLVDYYYDCIRIDNGKNEATDITFNNVITGDCENEQLIQKATKSESGTGAIPNYTGTPTEVGAKLGFDNALAGPIDHTGLNSAVDITPLEGRTDFTFDNTDYIGAVDPKESTADRAWWAGWTIPGSTDLKAELKAQAD